jgi:hypothetical protein
MAFNIYSTRTMMAAIDKMLPVNTFFMDTFFSNVETYPTEQIDVDFRKGKRKMAPFVAPRVGGITMDRQGFTTRSYTPPKIAPQRVLTKDDISTRAMGENVYSTRTPEERAAQILGKDLSELDEMISRREEWMCREIIINGKCVMKGFVDDKDSNTIDQEVDYGFTNKETLISAAKWDQATSNKLADLKRWRLIPIKKSGKAPTVCIMSSDVADLFLADPVVQNMFDKNKIKVGDITPTIVNEAVTFIGRIVSLGLDLYTYDEWYVDDAGVEQPMMPAKTLILGRPGMAKRIYGAVTQMDKGEFYTYEGERVPKSWADEENEVKMLKITSRPLPVPEDVDDWYVAVVY